MTKKYLADMSFSELKTLIENNDSLHHAAMDHIRDDAFNWVEDYLDGCPAKSYQIGSYCQGEHFYIDPGRVDQLAEWLNDVQKKYCLFNTEDVETIEKFCAGNEELLNNVNSIIYRRLQSEYDVQFDDGAQAETLMFMIDNGEISADLYTDENMKRVFQDIPAQYIPAHTDIVF